MMSTSVTFSLIDLSSTSGCLPATASFVSSSFLVCKYTVHESSFEFHVLFSEFRVQLRAHLVVFMIGRKINLRGDHFSSVTGCRVARGPNCPSSWRSAQGVGLVPDSVSEKVSRMVVTPNRKRIESEHQGET